ncbi:hypothetical protein PBI_KAMPE_110 [Gordonia phage Kampe]|uniref:Uncharacterized protein n=3 Tax=Gordonia phage Orchid TaxID=1838075 RepID=A0A160DHJ9_9CAUD|nr:hypothetical protein BH761_gp104 [Gordonia phage Orchid]ANA87342.1 hypothetical protein PBI_PATRICKSTAR_110 [Gordonia phage PatrickStar]ANA87453.1 hypothetical protein PBI_ORCHID_109 [Gordonia phage Orchid]ANA87568.1 hypothetical protein PBI_KAMPE_110 [Gordonia phage Kampe]
MDILVALTILLGVPTNHCHLDAPTRLSGTGELLEDESPYGSPCGAPLRAYSDGLAYFSDGWITDGNSWWKP